MKPLAGLVQFDDDGYEYRLLSKDTCSYVLRRRAIPDVADSERRPSFDNADGMIVGRFKASVLHQGLARVLRQLGERVPSRLPCPNSGLDLESLEPLRHDVREAEAKARRARELATECEPSETQLYKDIAATAQAHAAAIRVRIVEAEAARRTPPGRVLDAKQLAALVVILENLDGPADVGVHRAVRGIVHDLRIRDAQPGQALATLELTLNLHTDQGTELVGPLRTTIQNRGVGGSPGSDRRKKGFRDRNIEIATTLWLESEPADARRDLWKAEGFSPRKFVRRMETVLKPLIGPLVTSALIDCPILDVRRAAIRPFLNHELSVTLSEDLESEIQRIYRPETFSWSKGWCPGGMARERAVLGFINRYASDPDLGLPIRTVREAFGFDEGSLYRMVHEGVAAYGRAQPSPAPWYPRVDRHYPTIEGRSVPHLRIRQCPHCGQRTMLQPLRVPEVPGFLLCTDLGCRRPLLLDLPFPAAFFEPWDGAQSAARRTSDVSQEAQTREWLSLEGRAVVGAARIPIVYPSLHTPRTAPERE